MKNTIFTGAGVAIITSGVQLNTPTTGFRSLPEQAATIPSMPLNFLGKHRNSVQMACCW